MAYKQAQQRKKRLLSVYRQTKNHCIRGVAYDADRGFYYKYTVADRGRGKALRKMYNRRLRRTNIEVGNFRELVKGHLDCF